MNTITIVSFLLQKPIEPARPLQGEPKIDHHGVYPADFNMEEWLAKEVAMLGNFVGIYTEKKTDTPTTLPHISEAIKNPPGSLIVSINDPLTFSSLTRVKYTLWHIGERVDRGWVSKSRVPVLNNLGYYITLTCGSPIAPPKHFPEVFDHAIEKMGDIQRQLDLVCNRAEENVNTITLLTNEIVSLREQLANKDLEISTLRGSVVPSPVLEDVLEGDLDRRVLDAWLANVDQTTSGESHCKYAD